MEQLQKISSVVAPKVIQQLRTQIKDLKKENRYLKSEKRKADQRINRLRLRVLAEYTWLSAGRSVVQKVLMRHKRASETRPTPEHPELKIMNQKRSMIKSLCNLRKNTPFHIVREQIKQIAPVGRLRY